MKKISIFLGFVAAVVLILNVALNYFMFSMISEQAEINNEPPEPVEETKILYYSYPNQHYDSPLPTLLPDKETAFKVGKALLEEYYGVSDDIYTVLDAWYYWTVSRYIIIDSFTVTERGNREREMVTVEMYYVDISKHDGRVLFTGYYEEFTCEARLDIISAIITSDES